MTNQADVIATVQAGDVAGLRTILRAHPDLASAEDANGVSAVMHAFYYGKTAAAELLIARKPCLNIFEATAGGKTDRVSQILNEDPQAVMAFSADGFTALHFAAFLNHPGIARDLLGSGADVGAASRNQMKVTPLHSAVAARSREVVQLLLEHDAPVNAQQQGGWAPVHGAADNDDREMVQMLVDHGADLALTNDEGKTAAEIAQAKKHSELAQWLLQLSGR